MRIPDEPPIGSLVAHEYLWLSQKNTREDGAKVYPVALIFAKTRHRARIRAARWLCPPHARR
jgi:hypothetical protein